MTRVVNCLCGCGSRPKTGNKYIHGHNARVMKMNQHIIDRRESFSDSDFWYLYGLGYGDGHAIKNTSSISLALDSESFANKICLMMSNDKRISYHNGAYYVFFANPKLHSMLLKKPRIAPVPKKYVFDFISGIIDSDGWVTFSKRQPRGWSRIIAVEQKTRHLANFMKNEFESHGLPCNVCVRKDKRYADYYMHRIYVSSKQGIEKWNSVLSLRNTKHIEKLELINSDAC